MGFFRVFLERRWCKVLLPLPAAMLEIMAGAAQESKREARCAGWRWADRGAEGQRLGSVAGARGRGAAKGYTIVRDSYDRPGCYSRRWCSVLLPSPAELLEIMVGAAPECKPFALGT